jgi:hypothetical protein
MVRPRLLSWSDVQDSVSGRNLRQRQGPWRDRKDRNQPTRTAQG